ncbi:MAG TPA: glycosyltransferase family 2 protein [Thermoanaerobaculales bacterium]|nr:glycosyltransferase family 2 protein [Thermoanaerobaculales bacterium]
MKASVIVVTHRGGAHLADSLGSLARYAGRPDVEVVLVVNGAPAETAGVASRDCTWARIVRSETNVGFAGGANLGAGAASGEVLVLLNDDAAAGEGFVEAHLEALERHPEAAASGGRLTSWDGARHDFVRGRLTFDAHAFQLGQGRPVAELDPPAAGEPLPFACGGNLAIRRADWEAAGGFDEGLFAYFEDVELGWRLWATGRQVVAAPGAVARHRGAATSSTLGDFNRGVLFERNALRVFHACADAECRAAFGPAVYLTYLHRLVAFAEADPERARWVADPFTVAPSGRRRRWQRRLADDGAVATVRRALARLLLGRSAGSPRLDDGHLLMQLRAAHGFFAGLPACDARRRELERRRTVPDRELVARFPRLVVPTYLGDERWFASDEFRGLLPAGWPVEFAALAEIVAR